MKQFLILVVAVATAFISISASAMGQSFRQTCRHVSEDYYTVRAECQDRNGRWQYTRSSKNCNGDLANIDGQITCIGGASTQPDRPNYNLPVGSYLSSCSGCRTNGYAMSCMCEDSRGQKNYTSINYGYCHGDIQNLNGTLYCN